MKKILTLSIVLLITTKIQAQQIGGAPLYNDNNSRIGVGVGNSTPVSYSTLDVEGPHTVYKYASQLHLHSTAVDYGLFLGSYGGPTSAVSIISSGNIYYSGGAHKALHPQASAIHMHEGRIRFFSNDGLTVGANYTPTTRMVIYPNGNITMGGSTNSEKLNIGGRLFLGEHYNGSGSWYEAKGTSDWFAGLNAIDDFRIYYAGSNKLYIDQSGNVGIGTETLNGQLTVDQDIVVARTNGYSPIQDARLASAKGLYIGDAGYILDNNNGFANIISRSRVLIGVNEASGTYSEGIRIDNDALVTIGGGSSDARLKVKGQGNAHANKHFIVTDQYNNEDFVIRGNGQVEIGYDIDIPNSSVYKLGVGGGIIAEEVKVSTSMWPDFVFEEGYDLTNLESVESYIKTNKHLPDVPSATEVEAEGGIELGEMNRILLQKIEELTLHAIRQEKLIKELTNKVEKLENK